MPAGMDAQGFSFDNAANALTNDWESKFRLCQHVEESAMNSWELWWEVDGEPNEVGCLIGVDLIKVEACED